MKDHTHSGNCSQLLHEMSDYIDGQLQVELCAELERHIQTCENCRVVVNTLRKTIELYEQVTPPAELPDAVRERLFTRLQLVDFIKKE